MNNAQIFRIPAILGVIGTVGLLSALIGDGAYDVLSWVALGLPVALVAWYWAR